MDTTPYKEFAKEKLGFEFNNIELLVTALTHRSYVNEHKKHASTMSGWNFWEMRCWNWCLRTFCFENITILRG